MGAFPRRSHPDTWLSSTPTGWHQRARRQSFLSGGLAFCDPPFHRETKEGTELSFCDIPLFSTLDILMNAIYSLEHFTQNSLVSLDAYGLRDLKPARAKANQAPPPNQPTCTTEATNTQNPPKTLTREEMDGATASTHGPRPHTRSNKPLDNQHRPRLRPGPRPVAPTTPHTDRGRPGTLAHRPTTASQAAPPPHTAAAPHRRTSTHTAFTTTTTVTTRLKQYPKQTCGGGNDAAPPRH